MTYSELDSRANQLASHLRSLGVKPEAVVAICLERSVDFVISALAIWKAGGAYLPLDPSWPVARRNHIVQNASAPILITRASFGGRAGILVDVERDAMVIATAQTVIDLRASKREHLAYVSYTAGAGTGPKGIEITHGNLLNLVFWHRNAFAIAAGDRCSHLVSPAFDAAVWELWPQLSAGATVVLAGDDTGASPQQLQDWLVRERINVAFVPTPLVEPLIAAPWPETTALRYLLTRSDVLPRDPTPGLPFQLVNHYGPTECTVVAASGGSGIPHTPIYLLNERREPVLPGETGEIFIGGPGVGKGYRNQRDLTEKRFLPDPFSPVFGARMYRSGDVGSFSPSGELQIHGRLDRQETLRGHRVEPEEVAAVLNRHPDVRQSVVAGYGAAVDRKLAAYYIPRSQRTRPTELREFLREHLPEYMMPTAFLAMESLPADALGRLDPAALPDPTQDPAQLEALGLGSQGLGS